jgi:CRISPR-associated protein Cas1
VTTLYIREQGACLRRTGKRLKVVKGETELEAVRLRDLDRVVIFGAVELSAPALAVLLDAGVETVLLSATGRYRGRLTPPDPKNVFLRQAQFRRLDDEPFRLTMGRAIIAGKIRNARCLLLRHQRNHPEATLAQAVEDLGEIREKATRQKSRDMLLGVEGEGGRVYFAALGQMVRSEFAFTTRTRRPPRDPVNALLSFGYTVLCTELTGALAAQGLDPHVGILHDLDYGRPSLALDLLEEFRPAVVDALVLSLINRGVLKAEHFEDRGEAGVFLNESGRPRFLEFYHRSLETPFGDREDRSGDSKTAFRALFLRQARRMRVAIMDGAIYQPFEARS